MKNYFFIFFLFVEFSLCFAQGVDDTISAFPTPVFTNSNLSLLVLETAWNKTPKLGDEWAVIDSEGQIVGCSPIYEGHNGMPIWGDAPNTPVKDGLSNSERFAIVLWNKEEDTYTVYNQFSIYQGTVTYLKDGFTIVNSLGVPKEYKRPSNVYYHIKSVLSETSTFSMFVSQLGKYSLRVYYNDEIIFELKNKELSRGFYSYDYNNNLKEGKYRVCLYDAKNQVDSKDFFILK